MSLNLRWRRFRVLQERARLSHVKRILQRRVIKEGGAELAARRKRERE